jgi:hypothetical protein
MKKGRTWVISASGGVLVNSWAIVDKVQQSGEPESVRAKSLPTPDAGWWWN